MTLQTSYINYKNGNLTPSKFLYEIRKKNFPFLSPNNSLKDVITILKGQKLISEVKDKNPDIPQVDCKTIDMVSPHEYTKGMNFELDLRFKSAGQNSPTVIEISKAQDKVLKNLTKDSYYYSRKLMTDEEKKYEKGNEREYELKKQFIHNNKKGIIRENHADHDAQEFDFRQATQGVIADIIRKNGYSPEQLMEPTTWEEIEDEMWYTAQMNEEIPGDELHSVREDCGCQGEEVNETDIRDWDSDENKLNNVNLIKTLIEEWGLTEYDLQDDDVLDELADAVREKIRMNEIKVDKSTNNKWDEEIKSLVRSLSDGNDNEINPGELVDEDMEFEKDGDYKMFEFYNFLKNKKTFQTNIGHVGFIITPLIHYEDEDFYYINIKFNEPNNWDGINIYDDGLGEALAVKDAAGNVQYAKDDREATNMVNQAKTKGVQLQKQNI